MGSSDAFSIMAVASYSNDNNAIHKNIKSSSKKPRR
jgi:hypothetical protein